jgi:hypothetical protein
MAKHGNGGNGGKIKGPMYTKPGNSLGAAEVGGPTGGKTPPDPLGITHGITGKGPSPKGGKS